ncbi:hypothetical protein GCM10009682_09060 [Luedemannella flava]|uniref:Signal transduction histidine kinase n=1 Tax=Luedemannella flava TaxID=349316 RepID=A0ABP4XUR7_9ACTN
MTTDARPAAGYGHGYARGTALAAIIVAAVWHVLNNLSGTIVYRDEYRTPWPQLPHVLVPLAAWVVIAALIGLATADLLRRPHDTPQLSAPAAPVLVGVALLLAATLVVSSSACPKITFLSGNWAWTAFGWPAMLLLWRSPIGWLLGALGVNAVAVIVAIWLTRDVDRVDAARLVITLYGATAIQMGLFAGCRFMQRVAARAAAARAASAELETRKLVAEQIHEARQERYHEIGHSMGEILGGLADGSSDPGDSDVRRRSAVAAARLRRLIAERDDTDSPLLHELRACADIAERRGLVVGLEVVGRLPDLPVVVRRALTEAPIHLMAVAATDCRITIIAMPDEVEVSAVADIAVGMRIDESAGTGSGGATGVTVSWSRDEEAVWVRTTWCAR